MARQQGIAVAETIGHDAMEREASTKTHEPIHTSSINLYYDLNKPLQRGTFIQVALTTLSFSPTRVKVFAISFSLLSAVW